MTVIETIPTDTLVVSLVIILGGRQVLLGWFGFMIDGPITGTILLM